MAKKSSPKQPNENPVPAVHRGLTQAFIQNVLDNAREKVLTPNDFTVLDAADTITINVKQKDIDCAVAGNGGECVAAKACKRALDTEGVWVSRGYTWAWLDRNQRVIYRYRNSPNMTTNVVDPLDEDRKEDVVAGTYNLRAPVNSERLGEGARRKVKSRNNPERLVPKRRNRPAPKATSYLRIQRPAS